MSDTTDHAHPEYLQHHFHSAAQQRAASKLGIWVFIAQELLFFSGLFMAYAAFRFFYPETFLAAHEHLSVPMGAINTVVLITSSLTMALAVRCAQIGDQKWLKIHLALTIMFACCFLVVKYFEYSAKYHHCLLPGDFYGFPEKDDAGNIKVDGKGHRTFAEHCEIPRSGVLEAKSAGIFFGIYFVMTGMHGLHVLIGIGLLGWILWKSTKGKFHPKYYSPVEYVGLYWHLVDLTWFFLFPLLYLVK